MSISVLGTEYKIEYRTKKQDKKLMEIDGYCDYSTKTIVCIKRTKEDKHPMDLGDLKFIDNRILRHEIIHAFLFESGLGGSSVWVGQWALNEEMVDWFAMQFPKMVEVFRSAGCL